MSLDDKLGLRERFNLRARNFFDKRGMYSLADFLTHDVSPKSVYTALGTTALVGVLAAGCNCGGGGGGGGGGGTPVNQPPKVLHDFAKVTTLEDLDAYVAGVNAHFQDPEGQPLDIIVDGYTNVGAVLVGDTITVKGTPGTYGTETGRVTACDNANQCVKADLEVEVVQDSDPTITSVTVNQAVEGQIFYGQVNGTDPDLGLGDQLFYEFVDNSAFPELKIDSVTGDLFTDDVLDYTQAGDHDVLIRVVDLFGNNYQAWYPLTVANTNRAPVIDNITLSGTPTEGQAMTGTIFHHDDDGDPTGCYLITTTLPELRVTPDCSIYSCDVGNTCYNPGDGSVVADPLPPGAAISFDYEVGVTDGVEDDTAAGTETIQRPPSQPTTTCSGVPCGPNFTIGENPFFPLEITFYSTDPNGDPVTYESSTLPPGATLDPNTGVLSYSPTCSDAGLKTVGVHGRDDKNNQSVVSTIWITVNDTCSP